MDINYIGDLNLDNRKILINLPNEQIILVSTYSVDDQSLREYQTRTEEQLQRVKDLLKERKNQNKNEIKCHL